MDFLDFITFEESYNSPLGRGGGKGCIIVIIIIIIIACIFSC
jgi:hypothetical protein